jgi:hypothetical protein
VTRRMLWHDLLDGLWEVRVSAVRVTVPGQNLWNVYVRLVDVDGRTRTLATWDSVPRLPCPRAQPDWVRRWRSLSVAASDV